MAGLFITSTGTGTGKTFLTEQLLRLDYVKERCMQGSKPIITGWPMHADLVPDTDTGRLLAAQGREITGESISDISPWIFQAPLAPSRAAKRERLEIVPSELVAYCQKSIQRADQHHKLQLIEGVGGIMVPIQGQWTVLDWIQALTCPALLVVGSYLGTLSHTLSALSVLEARKIPLLGVVVSESALSDVPITETFESLQELLPTYPLFLLPKEETTKVRCLNALYTVLLQYLISHTMAPQSVTI